MMSQWTRGYRTNQQYLVPTAYGMGMALSSRSPGQDGFDMWTTVLLQIPGRLQAVPHRNQTRTGRINRFNGVWIFGTEILDSLATEAIVGTLGPSQLVVWEYLKRLKPRLRGIHIIPISNRLLNGMIRMSPVSSIPTPAVWRVAFVNTPILSMQIRCGAGTKIVVPWAIVIIFRAILQEKQLFILKVPCHGVSKISLLVVPCSLVGYLRLSTHDLPMIPWRPRLRCRPQNLKPSAALPGIVSGTVWRISSGLQMCIQCIMNYRKRRSNAPTPRTPGKHGGLVSTRQVEKNALEPLWWRC